MVSAPVDEADRSRRLARRLVIAALVCIALAALTYLLMVRTRLGQRLDNAALIGAFQQNTAARLSDGFFVQRVSAAGFILAMLAVLGLTAWRGRWRLGIALTSVAVLTIVATHVLKINVLTRPDLATSPFLIQFNSFPSGHTATAVSAALALVAASPPAIRGGVALLAGTYACFVTQDILTAGWHRPSDAIGAGLLTFAVMALVAAAFASRRPVGEGSRPTHRAAYAVLAMVWVVSGVLSALYAAHALKTLRDPADAALVTPSLRNDAHHFSIAVTVLVVATLLGLLLALLGSADLDEPPDPQHLR